MKVILPIGNLNVETISKSGKTIFIPKYFYHDYELNIEGSTLDKDELDLVNSVLDAIEVKKSNEYYSNTLALTEVEISEKEFEFSNADNDFLLLERISFEVNRELDCIRLQKCHYFNKQELIGIPGITGSFMIGKIIDIDKGLHRDVLGNVYLTYVVPGIGLSEVDISVRETDKEHSIYFSNREDEVYLKCRNALTRVNEAFYFPNVNTSFIYLMSTIEMLASSEYMRFQDVKPKIVTIISNNRNQYHEKSKELFEISKKYRTEVVHNGKSLSTLFDDEKKMLKLLNYLMIMIIQYCEKVIELDILTYNDLNEYITKKQIELGIS